MDFYDTLHLRCRLEPKFRSWVAFTAVLSRADGWLGLVVGALNQAGRSLGGGFRILPPRYLRQARLRMRHQRSTAVNCGAFWISRRKRGSASKAARNPREAACAIVSSSFFCRPCRVTRPTPAASSPGSSAPPAALPARSAARTATTVVEQRVPARHDPRPLQILRHEPACRKPRCSGGRCSIIPAGDRG